ncbi:unnamed protein product [Polarella glacialis]|uniref:Uncharacterized protein n=1 Tax=Polarella glacialis TaxID=89957 RepID=A0A813H6P4_POLGL|nr:unnamed protein product [Polarella glacialis]
MLVPFCLWVAVPDVPLLYCRLLTLQYAMSCHRDVGAWAASLSSGVSKAGRPGRFRAAGAMPLQTFSRVEPSGFSGANPSLPPCAVSLLPGASSLEGRRRLPCCSLALSYLEVASKGHRRLTGPAAAASATVSTNLPANKMVTVPATAAVAGVRENEMTFKPATAANVSAAVDYTRVPGPMTPSKPDTVSASSDASGDHEDRMPTLGTRVPEPMTPFKPDAVSASSDASGDHQDMMPILGITRALKDTAVNLA